MDRTDSSPWVTSWSTWQQCRVGRVMAAPYDALWPCVSRDSGVAGFTVATPCLITIMWVQTLRARSCPPAGGGRLLGIGLLTAGFLEPALSWFSSWGFLGLGRLRAAGLRGSQLGEGGPTPWMLGGLIGL